MQSREWMNKYHILQQLATSENSTVYLAEHLVLQDRRIIKRIAKKNACYQQLIQEAYILKNLRLSNVPLIYDMEDDEDYSYIIEEYIDGESLATFIFYQNDIPEQVIIDLVIQLATTIQLLHSTTPPILYLDLKPQNIIVSHDRVKLIDFGAAICGNQVDEREFSFGTPGFAAPEQSGIHEIDVRSDIYGLGRIAECLLKKQERHSHQLEQIISRCTNNNPTKRYQQVSELVRALSKLQNKHKMLYDGSPRRIAVMGVKPGIGTTYAAIAMAYCLNQSSRKTIYFDLQESALPALIQYLPSRKEDSGIWSIEQGAMQAALSPKDVHRVSATNRYYIYDCGCVPIEAIAEEEDSYDWILLIAGNAFWDNEKMMQIQKRLSLTKPVIVRTRGGSESAVPELPLPFRATLGNKGKRRVWNKWARKCIKEFENEEKK